jgi:hypothetical protein
MYHQFEVVHLLKFTHQHLSNDGQIELIALSVHLTKLSALQEQSWADWHCNPKQNNWPRNCTYHLLCLTSLKLWSAKTSWLFCQSFTQNLLKWENQVVRVDTGIPNKTIDQEIALTTCFLQPPWSSKVQVSCSQCWWFWIQNEFCHRHVENRGNVPVF